MTEYPHFFTATILGWKKLLKPGKYKDILIESMQFLATDQRVIIYGFVVMINHIHVIVETLDNFSLSFEHQQRRERR